MSLATSFAYAGGEVQPGSGWRYRVYADNLPAVDNLVARRDGSIYATQSMAGNGRVVRVRAGQAAEVVAGGLDHPRGLLVKKNLLYVTEQTNGGHILEIDVTEQRRRMLGNFSNPEHIEKLPNGELIVTENGMNGRLVRLSSRNTVEVVTAGLNDPEGLAVGNDGTIYIGENGTGRILAFKDGVLDVVIDDLDEVGQIEAGSDGALWITEKGTPGRLLRLKDGALTTVLNGLKDPRGVALIEDSVVLISEHGRARILLAEPKQ
jgi:glucose/arabinose dehydrogenase